MASVLAGKTTPFCFLLVETSEEAFMCRVHDLFYQVSHASVIKETRKMALSLKMLVVPAQQHLRYEAFVCVSCTRQTETLDFTLSSYFQLSMCMYVFIIYVCILKTSFHVAQDDLGLTG